MLPHRFRSIRPWPQAYAHVACHPLNPFHPRAISHRPLASPQFTAQSLPHHRCEAMRPHLRPFFCMNPRLPLSLVAALAVSAPLAFAAEFKFGDATITVPDGYTVERIAAAPLVDRPISAAFD